MHDYINPELILIYSNVVIYYTNTLQLLVN